MGYNGEFVFFESMVLVFLFLSILSYNFPLNQPDIDFFSIHFQVHLSFLFVGHTHEDVDARLPRLCASKMLKHLTILSVYCQMARILD